MSLRSSPRLSLFLTCSCSYSCYFLFSYSRFLFLLLLILTKNSIEWLTGTKFYYNETSKKAPTFREEMNCEEYINAQLIVCMESPVNKSFAEGMQDISIQKPVRYWFGMPPQSVPSIAGKGISRLYTDRDVCKGSTDTPKGATFRTGTTLKLKDGGSAKRSQTVRDEGVTGSKSRTSVALARRVYQSGNTIYIPRLSILLIVFKIFKLRYLFNRWKIPKCSHIVSSVEYG